MNITKIALYASLCLTFQGEFVYAQWQQKEFFVGTFADPRLSYTNDAKRDSISFFLARAAYINLLTGPQFYYTTRDYTFEDKTLALAAKFGMKAMVIDARLSAVQGPLQPAIVDDMVAHYSNLDPVRASAFIGYYLGGEFPMGKENAIRQWTEYFKKKSPNTLVYSYLLPAYGFSSMSEYEKYVEAFEGKGGPDCPDVVSYDYYPFQEDGSLRSTYVANIDLIRRVAGPRPFWVYVLTQKGPGLPDPNEYQMNYATFVPLAYGAKGVIYYTWETIPARYNLKNGTAIIDENGVNTKKFDVALRNDRYLKEILGPVVMGNNWVAAYHSSPDRQVDVPRSEMLGPGSAVVQAISAPGICVGVFESADKSTNYLIFVNKGDAPVHGARVTLQGSVAKSGIFIYPTACTFGGAVAAAYLKTRAGRNPEDSEYSGGGNSGFVLPDLNGGDCALVKISK